MAKIAILSFDKDGWVSAELTDFTNDKEAAASIKEAGTYAFLEVHEIQPTKEKKDK